MIPINQSSQIQTSNNVLANDFSIEVNESMFQMLTADVYNDPIQAVVREWSTNAVDSCVEANQPVHFEVNVPTAIDPTFSVRDYGLGMSEEFLTGTFLKLGASTKRDSNDSNGTLGIGRMAGLAASDSFTVESFYNGKHYTYVVTKDNQRLQSLKLGEATTDEPNGVRLSLSVELHKITEFKEAMKKVYRYFENKPILSEPLPSIYRDSSKDMSPNWFFDDALNANTWSMQNYVLMSNVVYKIPNNNQIDTKGFKSVILKMPNGSVSFNPGRETLSLNDTTIENINAAFSQAFEDYEEKAEQIIDAQSKPIEIIKAYTTALRNSPSYKEFTDAIKLEDKLPTHISSLFGNRQEMLQSALDTAYNNAVQISLKESYRKTLYNGAYNIDMRKLPELEVLIIDVKTRFSEAVQSMNDAIVLKRNTGVSLEDFMIEAKKFISDFGYKEYKLASDYITETVSKATTRSGIYVCPADYTTLRASTKEDETKEYWYVNCKQTDPDLGDVNYTFRDLSSLYQILDTPENVELVGIQKKYQNLAAKSDRYHKAYDKIMELTNKQEFILVGDTLKNKREVDQLAKLKLPPDLQEFVDQRNFVRNLTNTHSEQKAEVLRKFGISYTLYKYKKPFGYIFKKYPLLEYFIGAWNINKDSAQYYIDLEAENDRLRNNKQSYHISYDK